MIGWEEYVRVGTHRNFDVGLEREELVHFPRIRLEGE